MICQLMKDGNTFPSVYNLCGDSLAAQRRGQLMGKFGLLRSTVAKIEECGVDLKKMVCDLTPDAIQEAELCLVFTGPEGRPLARAKDHGDQTSFRDIPNNFCFPGSDMLLFANKREGKGHPSGSDRMAVILLNTCICNDCQLPPPPFDESRWPRQLHEWSKVVNWELQPAVITLKLENGDVTKTFEDLEFKPAHAFSSGMKDPQFSDIAPHRYNVVFYAEVSLKSLEFMREGGDDGITKWNSRELRPSISILEIKQARKKHGLKPPLEDESVPTDFVIISPDGVEHPCHQAVLKARSKYFESKFSFESRTDDDEERKPERVELPHEIMTEDGPRFTGESVEALLNFLYSEEPVQFDWSFELAAGLVKLAHFYQIPDLLREATTIVLQRLNPKSWCMQRRMATASDLDRWVETCLSLMDSLRFQPGSLRDVGILYELYCFAHLLDSVELMDRMKTEVGLTLKEWVAKNKKKLGKAGEESDGTKIKDGSKIAMKGGEDKAAMVDWVEKISLLMEKVELTRMWMQRRATLKLLENRKFP